MGPLSKRIFENTYRFRLVVGDFRKRVRREDFALDCMHQEAGVIL